MTLYEILCDIAERQGVTVEEIRSRKRTANLVQARILFACRAKVERSHLTTGQIGMLINRSTWTIQYYIQHDMRLKRQARQRWKKRLIYAERFNNGRDRFVRPGMYQKAA